MVIDSHIHFWKYEKASAGWMTDDMKILRQHYLPDHLALTLKRNQVDGVVAVQADQSELETLFLKELAGTHPFIRGVVGWVDLQDEKIEERLEYFSQFPIIKGWRHIVQSEPAGFLLKESFIRGIQALAAFDYSYDILVYHRQLEDVISFLQKVPEQRMVIDHCAKPDIGKKDLAAWSSHLREIATQPQVYCKVSGLFTETAWKKWSPADFYPYLDVVFDAFGPGRILYGSDWPVMLLSGMYVQWKSLLEKYMEGFTDEEKEAVFGGNAIKFYTL